MDYKLAKEIYGSIWMIDPITLTQYSKMLDYFHNGGKYEEPEVKGNSFGIISQGNVFNARRIQRMEDVPDGSIAQYNFDSVITKHGGLSHYGTTEIASQFRAMEKNDNVIGHIFKIESGGGSASAIKYIRDVSAKANRTKPLVAIAEDVMASAAMYIASDADYIYANSNDTVVGSIGTMIELSGHKNGTEDSNGERHIRIYASQSVNKNAEFEKAINDYNYSLIRKTLLDPHAAEFISDMEANRPNITEAQKTGAIFRAEDTVGTLIDEIGNFDDAVNKIHALSNLKNKTNTVISSKPKVKIMDKATLMAEHPALYAQILDEGNQAGVAAERDRVGAWAVYNEVDPEAVKAGIESGESLTAKKMAEFNLQIAKGEKVEAQKKDNPKPVDTKQQELTESEIQAQKDKEILDKEFGNFKSE
jgi:protease-4